MKNKIFSTGNNHTGLVTRLTIGLIIFPHGAQKLLGWFGGFGFNEMMNYFTGAMHLPWLIAFLVIMIEFFGSLSLIAGFAGRIWSGIMVILFIGIILTAQISNGFFMNWFGNQKGEGIEYSLLVIGLSIATLINGSGKYSADDLIMRNIGQAKKFHNEKSIHVRRQQEHAIH